ncbi:MAG: site-2 protease family protein [Maioricimonas sp. JB049]
MFTKRFRVCNLLGIPVYLDLGWFAIALLITWSLATGLFPQRIEGLSSSTYWLMGIAGTLGLFASILAHELGHAAAARWFDVPIRGITLFLFGGVAEMSREPPHARAEFHVAIAGPIVSILIVLLCAAIGMAGGHLMPDAVAAVVWYLGLVNAVVVGFNLIPAFPLDGGRVLRSILWHFKRNLTWATWVSSSIGSAFGLVLVGFGVLNLLTGNVIAAIWQAMLGLFLRNAARMSYQHVLARQALEGEPVHRFMQRDVLTVDPSLSVEELVENHIYRLRNKMFPVTSNGRLLGCVTTRNVQRLPRRKWSTTTVAEITTHCAPNNTIPLAGDAMDALTHMSQNLTSRVMVVDDDRLVGMLSLRDLVEFISLKAALEEDGQENSDTVLRPEQRAEVRRSFTTMKQPTNGALLSMADHVPHR